MFWKHYDFAGESEFLDQVIGSIKDLEPLCGRDKGQDCHFVWHNEPLTMFEAMTDDEEARFIERYGVDHYLAELTVRRLDAEQRKADAYKPS